MHARVAETRSSHPCSVLPEPIPVDTIQLCGPKKAATTVTASIEHPFQNRITTCTSTRIYSLACLSSPAGVRGLTSPPPRICPIPQRPSERKPGNHRRQHVYPTPNTKRKALLLNTTRSPGHTYTVVCILWQKWRVLKEQEGKENPYQKTP